MTKLKGVLDSVNEAVNDASDFISRIDDAIDFSDSPSLTVQSMAKECDVNHILERYARTGEFDADGRQPQYLDLSVVPDFQESLNVVAHVTETFNALDPMIRARFNNDPAVFLDFAANPENLEALRAVGVQPVTDDSSQAADPVSDKPSS